jgi:N-acetylglucosaminyldiphosphoundecaprenol N-acetyl-beta-D-mannosaminyltransferase
MRKLLTILGVPIDDLTMVEALARIEWFIAEGRRRGLGHQIATVNADFLVKSFHDPVLRRILRESDMATADGMPLVWGARRLGVPLQERVTGSDMVPALAALSAEKGYSLYLLGAAPGVAQQAADVLLKKHPSLNIVGVDSPPFAPVEEMDPAIIGRVRMANPDILLVAFGNPKQEYWIHLHAQELGVPVMMGVGATLDFIAGASKRAPVWMQKIGMEWLHRLGQEPKRMWKRYVHDFFGFGYFFTRQWWHMRRGAKPSLVVPSTTAVMIGHTAILHVRGSVDIGNYQSFVTEAEGVLAETNCLIVSLEQAEFLDSTVIGSLIGLSKQAREAGGQLWLVKVPAFIQETIDMLSLDEYFAICPDVVTAQARAEKYAPPPEFNLAPLGELAAVN